MTTEEHPGFFARLALAFAAFFRILFDPELASRWLRARQALPAPAEPTPVETPKPLPTLTEAPPDAALQLLGLLQRDGRFIDFLKEDVSAYSDADIGAAARVVHEGCVKALADHLAVEPIRTEEEGTRVRLEAGFDAAAIRVTGQVVGEPPFQGVIRHRGWRATQVKLPKIAEGHDASILAPAEVEL